jgi:hypothetical protein
MKARIPHHQKTSSLIPKASRLYPFAISLGALIWVAVRVLPKPSRAGYPCMRVAMSLASGLLLPISAFLLSIFSLRKGRELLLNSRIWLAASLIVGGLVLPNFISTGVQTADRSFATSSVTANDPIGRARGIYPGRVVWAYDSTATNKNCSPAAYGHGWFLSENTNQSAIDTMLSNGLRGLTGETSDSAAWNAVFRFHNKARGKGDVGYQTGERVFVKINATSSWSGNINPTDLSKVQNSSYGISETSPQLVLSLLRQLVRTAGVAQTNIYIGDPLRHIYKHCYDLWHAEFPNIHYLDHDGWGGREKVTASQTALIRYSDRGSVLRTSGGAVVTRDYLYTIFETAEYMINIPMLKAHKHAGITIFAKNHFGSHTRSDASHLHGGLVSPDGVNPTRQGYGLYRVQVDLMAHSLLGRKNLLYLMDALWATDYELDAPVKWNMSPFNGNWMSSIFLSLDPVAIESVGFDFLHAEFTVARGLYTYVQMTGTDDYLHQAADSTTWPAGIVYDPDSTGSPVASLGVHEHWDNDLDKRYSRNLGTGAGIELVRVPQSANGIGESPLLAKSFQLDQNFPNPFNPTTAIRFLLPAECNVRLAIYDLLGRQIALLVNERKAAGTYELKFDASGLASGVYLCRLTAEFPLAGSRGDIGTISPSNGQGSPATSGYSETRKMVVLR